MSYIQNDPIRIKVYWSAFLQQFGHVLTTQEAWAVGHHPGIRREQTSYAWFYADSDPRGTYDTVKKHIPLEKNGVISAVCSRKKQRNTLHRTRYDFVQEVKAKIPEMELYGRGNHFIEDKADALDPFKYHTENLSAILESRRGVAEDYALAANISRLVNLFNKPNAAPPSTNDVISSRHVTRRKSVVNMLSFATKKAKISLRHTLQPSQK